MTDGYPPNFNPGEFHCKCRAYCNGESPHPDRTRHLAWTLQRIRNEIGFGIRINSSYRCPAHNRNVGGASQSKHLEGIAADIDVVGVNPKDVADTIEELMDTGAIPNGGLGRYKTFTHVDIRNSPARWGSNG
jgi:uncharacterized protein YcbK (DUF882 family)